MTTVSMTDPLVGHVLDGRYEIQRKLARGGMATVYLANDLRLTRVVAVKVMHEGLGDDQDFAAKFDREARAAARLSHPNVVSVFDQGIDAGRPYIVMEYVEGCTLRHMITREAPFEPLRALELLLPVANALAAAHEAGLIHRDIKPENVLISDRGQIKVADFGLAKAISAQTATATGMLIGTVSYIAPELVTHGRADPRCDVYALGVVLYELLTGQKPHTGENPIQVAYSHVHNAVPAPSSAAKTSWRESRNGIPPYLDALVTTAAARQPVDRPRDGRVLLDHLRLARNALAKGLMDDPALDERMRLTDLETGDHVTQVIMPTSPVTAELPRVPTLRFTPSTPVSPGFPQTADGLPYYDGPPADPKPLVAAPAKPRRRGTLALLLAFVLVLVGAGVWYVLAGRFVSVPDLVKLNQQQATAAAAQAGLKVTFDSEFSRDVDSGLVTRTDPLRGSRVEGGSTLRVYLSKGPELYPVPKLIGLTLEQATTALTNSHLALGNVADAYDDKAEPGTVIGASVKAGVQVEPGRTVDLTVSQGPAPVTVEDWTGKKLTDAKKALEAAGLTVVVGREQFSDEVKKGLIINQDPGAGELHRGDTVTFVVSKGPNLVAVPNVRGMRVAAAKAKLAEAGFKSREQYMVSFGFGLVYYTNPRAGTKAPKGSTITLVIG